MTSIREKFEQARQFLHEVYGELRKVVWPSWKETRAATIVVLVLVALVSVYLGLIDFALSQIVERVLSPRLS
ncbi:MAG: preprotein translocase subunit SecE [Candidatus Binatia bacterium]